MVLSDDEQKQLLGAVARHLRVLQEIPDLLPHLHTTRTPWRCATRRCVTGAACSRRVLSPRTRW